jgi:hypothetical protein
MQKVSPNSIRKIKTDDGLSQLENVMSFREACLKYGLVEDDVFATNALWQGADIPAVIKTIESLSILVSNNDEPGYNTRVCIAGAHARPSLRTVGIVIRLHPTHTIGSPNTNHVPNTPITCITNNVNVHILYVRATCV